MAVNVPAVQKPRMLAMSNWDTPQKILVILAHPDDPEFFCGGTLAKWALEGHEIHYLLLTCGDKGRNQHNMHIPGEELCRIRHVEQHNAAEALGVKSVKFLDYEDGTLEPTMELRKSVTREIRRYAPDVLVTCDPQHLFTTYGLNHPDHRAAGQVVIDALFPAAGNELFFPELAVEGFKPHMPRELWASLTGQANTIIDISSTAEIKIQALLCHSSQIGDPQAFLERIKKWRDPNSSDKDPIYKEEFRVVKWQ